MMRFIANENISGTVIRDLRDGGHYVISEMDATRGAEDSEILRRAEAEERVVIPHDKDFAEMAFRWEMPADCGVVLFRLAGSDPGTDNRRMLEVLASRSDWRGHFAVVTDDRIRMRSLPPRS